eukprot:3871364-Prymnesium_polylepis.1
MPSCIEGRGRRAPTYSAIDSCALQYHGLVASTHATIRRWEREARVSPTSARVPGVGSSVRIVL